MTTVEEAVKRHGHRPGYRLLSYREVALPLWKLNLRCRVLEHRPIPPLEEFALKTVDAGLSAPEMVASFLGVEEPVLRGVVTGMTSDDLVALRQTGDDVVLQLTPKGRRALHELSLVFPEDRQYPVYFDGLTRQLTLPDVPLERPRDVADRGLLEIPAVLADPPVIRDLSKNDLDTLVRARSTREALRDLLSIEAIEGRRERWFAPAVALVFQATATAETQVAFLIDGRPSSPHEAAFAAAEGAKKIGVLRRLRESEPLEAARSVLPDELIRQATGSDEGRQLREAASIFADVVDAERERLATTSVELERESARDRLKTAEERLATVEAELLSLPVRQLEVYEHAQLLDEALKDATRRLLIVSPWIRAAVVDEEFLALLRSALERGVLVLIGYGLGDLDRMPERDIQALDHLMSLESEFANLTLSELGDTHAKVLVVDERFVVVTSFNWLSFRGDPDKPFRDERGLLVTDSAIVEQLFSDFAGRIRPSAT